MMPGWYLVSVCSYRLQVASSFLSRLTSINYRQMASQYSSDYKTSCTVLKMPNVAQLKTSNLNCRLYG